MESPDAEIGAHWDHEPKIRKCLEINETIRRFMERGDCRRRPLIVPMNLGESALVEATRSVAARSFGAFVPVGETGSGALHVNCLVTPVRVFPLGSFAFFCLRAGRVASSLNFRIERPPDTSGRGLCCLDRVSGFEEALIPNGLRRRRFMGSKDARLGAYWDHEPGMVARVRVLAQRDRKAL